MVLDADEQRDAKGNRDVNGQVALRMPTAVIRAKAAPYLRNGKPVHRPELQANDAYGIVAQYQAGYRGLAGYYRMAFNLHRLSALKHTMGISLAKTLAGKSRCRASAVWRRYGATIEIDGTPRRVLEVKVPREGKTPLVARWGGVSLKYRTGGVTLDDIPRRVWNRRSEVVERLLADTCERCGSRESVEVHHVRRLADQARQGRRAAPDWLRIMAARRRKTLVVCRKCHEGIHAGVVPGKAEGHRRAV
jgi:hypothetical protein